MSQVVTLSSIKIDPNLRATKTGKEYNRVSIKVLEMPDVLTGLAFENSPIHEWKVGDTLELEIERNGQYVNFRLPSRMNDALKPLKEDIQRLTGQILKQQEEITKLNQRLDKAAEYMKEYARTKV